MTLVLKSQFDYAHYLGGDFIVHEYTPYIIFVNAVQSLFKFAYNDELHSWH